MMKIKLTVVLLLTNLIISGCAGLIKKDPFSNLTRAEAHAMSLCGMGLVHDEDEIKTKLQHALLDNTELSQEKRLGVKKAYDSCLKNINRGFNDSPGSIPKGYPEVEFISTPSNEIKI